MCHSSNWSWTSTPYLSALLLKCFFWGEHLFLSSNICCSGNSWSESSPLSHWLPFAPSKHRVFFFLAKKKSTPLKINILEHNSLEVWFQSFPFGKNYCWMVSETRRPAVGGHEVRINCASWMNRATINYGTLLGAPIRSTPNMLKLPFCLKDEWGCPFGLKKQNHKWTHTALCLKENANNSTKRLSIEQQQGPSSLSLCNWVVYQPYKLKNPLSYALMQPKIQGLVQVGSSVLC